MPLKRTKQHVTTPGELDDLLAARLKQLGCYASVNEYVNSLILYDCWAEKPHLLTGPVFARRREQLPALVAEVVRDYGKPGKTGSFFEHRIEEVIIERVLKTGSRKPETGKEA